MSGRYAIGLRKVLYAISIAIMVLAYSSCDQQSNTPNGNQSQPPIKIGISLSLSGDFVADGKAMEQGYQLWADNINQHGGLLGRQVQLDILSDASSDQKVAANYEKLITVDKVDLVFGPFSSLLTKPASLVASRHGYAMVEGAGGGPSVFDRGLHNLFDVSLPVDSNLVSFAEYILSLPIAMRPKTAAYATEDDPFTQPQVDLAKKLLDQGGVKSVFYHVYPSASTNYAPIAADIIASGAQVAIFGTLLQDITAFIRAFKQHQYNPQALIATAGPDLGDQFIKAVGLQSTEGVMVPNGWYPQANNLGNAQMVQSYLAKYGGTLASINSDVAEAYSVGQVLEQAANKIHSINNNALIQELHADTFASVQGVAKFDSTGKNTQANSYLFQWQQGNLIPVFPSSVAAANPEFPKPQWH
ncbi:MAG TPA: amino acid ABC transporter substrate-binding protein [Ktedonobacteraceae bacterium]|nr:amino acid ABC transporter substrate-binding protein [Ktedonobacteraceae bacterium]